MKTITLSGAKVYGEDNNISYNNITFADGKITALNQESAGEVINLKPSFHVVPGMIDMHIHGSSGADVMDATAQALTTITQSLARVGTTSFLATTMSEPVERIDAALKNIANFNNQQGAEILGVHLEGPYLAPSKKGAQDGHFLLTPNIAQFERWQTLSNQKIKLITVAPELDNAFAFITYATQQNVIVSIGHSNASFALTTNAITAGASHATHLFNAMGKLQHRDPGTAGALLLSDRVMAELIADNNHLHPAMLELTYRIKGCKQCVLVTDATRGQCMQEGQYDLGGQDVYVKGGAVRLANGTLAGSVITQYQAAINMQNATKCSMHDLIDMTAMNPARALKIADRKGSIAVGKDADLCVLDENRQVVMTICRGEVVYRA